MTRAPRSVDRRLPADRVPDHAEKPRLRAGHEDAFITAVPRPTAADRACAVAYLTRRGHGDLLDVLGLAS